MWNKLIDFLRGSSATYEKLFKKSIEEARKAGVPEDKILKTIGEIDRYFQDPEKED